jgi:hypothetical protein
MASSSREPHTSEFLIPFSIDRIAICESLPDAEYKSLPELIEAYQSHAYRKGYAVVLADSKSLKIPNRVGRELYINVTGGESQVRIMENLHSTRKRADTGSRKCNCRFAVEAQELGEGSERWRGRILVDYHNHTPSQEVTSD